MSCPFSLAMQLSLLLLWMSRCGFDTFCLVVNFVDDERILRHCMFLVYGLTTYIGDIRVQLYYQHLLQRLLVARAVMETLMYIVQQCVLNQIKDYCLFTDALLACIAICNKLQVDVNTRATHVSPYKLGEADAKLENLYARVGGEAFGVLAPFLAFATSFVKEKAHNMLALMLDPIFKESICITRFVGRDKGQALGARV
jgi:hypothetical protein